MTVTFDLYAVLIGILIILGVVFLGYLIALIRQAILLIKDAKLLLGANRQYIDDTLKSVPNIASNIEKITGEVDEGLMAATQLAQNVEARFKDEGSSAYDKTQTTIEAVQMVGQLVKNAVAYFDNRKRKR